MKENHLQGERQFVSFFLDDTMYGLDIHVIKEVNPNIVLAEIPKSKAYIRGLVNIRGQVVLVMDISVIFNNDKRPINTESQLVILKTASEILQLKDQTIVKKPEIFGDKLTGFLVDRIGDVMIVERARIEPPPPNLMESHIRYVEGVIPLDRGAMIILNAEEIISSNE
ncbi:MAG: hypothetical protein ACD_79C00821G0002 [uncultured bacterium]|nr:MAG: hypothetical protein ACD_79C00821G0002 [uncultured bacterium]